MSENQPKPPDRTPLYIAIVGALATVGAALIGVLPNMLNRNAPTITPIVITATPVPTQVSIQTSVPTNTSPPTVSIPTTAPPTNTAEATLPPATPVVLETATARPTPTISNDIMVLVMNNLPQQMEFFVDDAPITKIDSGAYAPLTVKRGKRIMKQCVVGTDYNDPNSCFATDFDFQSSPEVWMMFNDNNPLLAQSSVKLVVLNRDSTPQDLYIDGQLATQLQPFSFQEVIVAPGTHALQSCAAGIVPPNGGCGTAVNVRYASPLGFFKIEDESS